MKDKLINTALAIAVLTSVTVGQQKPTKTKRKLQTKTSESACKTNLSQKIKQKVEEIIIDELGVDKKEVTFNARLIEDLGADSLDCVELLMRFEEEFKIEIPDEDTENLNRVCDIFKYLEKRLKNKK